VLISPEIVGREGTHFVKDMAQKAPNLFFHVDLLLKEVKLIHSSVHTDVIGSVGDGVELSELGNENLMYLLSQIFLDCTADGRSHIFGESFVNFLLVIVHGGG
jgi:hypothetical protein